jgi:transposase
VAGLYEQLDLLQSLRQKARHDLLHESRKHPAVKLLRQIPSIGPIRAALLVALLQTPHRFRSQRQLWAYSGFAVEIQISDTVSEHFAVYCRTMMTTEMAPDLLFLPIQS